MPVPESNATLVTAHTGNTEKSEFWLSDPEQIEDGEGDWGFASCAEKDVWIATFTYCDEASPLVARLAIVQALEGAVYVATAES